jgi:hypothetical protein
MPRTIHRYRVYCTTDAKYEYIWAESTDPVPSLCPANTVHIIDASKTAIMESIVDEYRTDEEGKLLVGIDAGTSTTDPKFYPGQYVTNATGDNRFTTPFTAAGKRIQGIRFQVKSATKGDTLDLQLASDGTVPQYGPPGTVLKAFGPVCAPQATDVTGWARDSIVYSTSKLVPPGMRLDVVYGAEDAAVRDVLIDYMMQE